MKLKKIYLKKTIITPIPNPKKGVVEAFASHPDIKIGNDSLYLITYNKRYYDINKHLGSRMLNTHIFYNPNDLYVVESVGGVSFNWYLSLNLNKWEVYEIILD
jgi:hypothetical protein